MNFRVTKQTELWRQTDLIRTEALVWTVPSFPVQLPYKSVRGASDAMKGWALVEKGLIDAVCSAIAAASVPEIGLDTPRLRLHRGGQSESTATNSFFLAVIMCVERLRGILTRMSSLWDWAVSWDIGLESHRGGNSTMYVCSFISFLGACFTLGSTQFYPLLFSFYQTFPWIYPTKY